MAIGKLKAENVAEIVAVSYTHLDVYKRQAGNRRFLTRTALEGRLQGASGRADGAIGGAAAVSYTHLHLLVVLERYGIGLDEFAAELNNRMTDAERPEGGVRLHEDHVKRGK